MYSFFTLVLLCDILTKFKPSDDAPGSGAGREIGFTLEGWVTHPGRAVVAFLSKSFRRLLLGCGASGKPAKSERSV